MSSEPLRPSDFAQFFREVNQGLTPFPWQERLAQLVDAEGKWPECLDLPTGSGKTAVLEIAVFHLALEARRLTERHAPVRIAFVVDRRLIVDQAEIRAHEIRRQLETASGDSITGRIARELSFLAGEGNPCLMVAKLRGGIPQEKDWARTPVQPTVLLSTVDQVGSRLLFRGYGVSDSMKPVHAGLLGSDCLIFLDEAHLSEPFRQTLTWIGRYRDYPWSEKPPGPWSVVTLSATPGLNLGAVFSLQPADLDNETLRKRVEASKPAELRQISGADTAREYTATARKMAEGEGINKILIVVNRVDLARAIFRELAQEGAVLMTGRVREVDRNRIVTDLLGRMKRPGEKLFAVATQCVEAGADLDFDALVTQIAPLDALRQRFGRLNRTGRDIAAKSAILATKEEIRPKKPDPLYEFRARETWKLLESVARSEGGRSIVDFGVAALGATLSNHDAEAKAACCKKEDAPVMPPAYVDLWTCTSPRPAADPDVALFLHGPESGPADVQIVWRSDILQGDLTADATEMLTELLAAVPPRPGETLAAPIWRVRDWLAKEKKAAAMLGDLEGEKEPEGSPTVGRPVLRWSGADDERTRVSKVHEILPGDVIVVPASYGGCDEWGWTGTGEPPVVDDVAEEAAEQFGARDIAVRLHPSLFCDETWGVIREILEKTDDSRELREELLDVPSLPDSCRQSLRSIEDRTEEITFLYREEDASGGIVLTGRRIKEQRRRGTASTENDDSGDHSAGSATLEVHTRAVRAQVVSFVERAGVNGNLRRSLEFAAELHDSGKGDGRFQSYLSNGNPGVEILAKSKSHRLGPARERQLRESVGLPDHWRHEALSVRLALQDPYFCSEEHGMDRELALWLIGTHHGHGRPFFPHDDPLDDRPRHVNGPKGEVLPLEAAPGPQRLDFNWDGRDWPELFDLLRRRYGSWELARLEAMLRLADHRASEE